MEPSKEANGHPRPLDDVAGDQYSALPTSGGDRTQLIPQQGGDRASGSSMESGTEVSPLQMELGKQTNKCQAEGLKVIVISAISFSVAITVALIITIYFGPPQVPLHGAVACDSPVCAAVGTDILKKGGSSVDAAIAATFCLTVVHPFSASIGGGGYFITRDNRKNDSTTIDARETAPAHADSSYIEGDDGGMTIAVPGLLRGLELAHKEHGKLSWEELIQPSIELANVTGFEVTQAFMDSLEGLNEENTREYVNLHQFLTQKSLKWPSLNDILYNRDLAATLSTVAKEGAKAFYDGPLARDIVKYIEDRNGIITDSDFKNYEALKGQPLETIFQGMTVQTVAPPAGGALMLMMLNVLEELEGRKENESVGLAMHWFIEAQKFSGTENGHLGDPRFASAVYNITARMISMDFAAELANASDATSTHSPQWYSTTAGQAIRELNAPGTCTVSVIGADEIMVTISTTLGSEWGSKEMAAGVILNDQMNAFTKTTDAHPDPNNMVEAGKRPASYMLPSLVFSYPKPCAVRMALGGGGGERGPAAVAQVIWAVLKHGENVETAIQEPRFYASLEQNKVFYEESHTNSTIEGAILQYLQRVGDNLQPVVGSIGSEVNAAAKINETVTAYGDPRNGGGESVF